MEHLFEMHGDQLLFCSTWKQRRKTTEEFLRLVFGGISVLTKPKELALLGADQETLYHRHYDIAIEDSCFTRHPYTVYFSSDDEEDDSDDG